jgi:hypothetical protein
MRDYIESVKDREFHCPACGEEKPGIHLREIMAISYAFDPATNGYQAVEVVPPESVGFPMNYDEHPRVMAVCCNCDHEWGIEL